MKYRPLLIVTVILLLCLGFYQVAIAQSTAEEWIAPQSADSLANPFTVDKKFIKSGAALYNTACVVCHGTVGVGDGIASVALIPRPADLTGDKTQDQSDGAIFWKLTEGRPPMAAYKAIYSAEQRWQLVEHIRNLRK